MMDSKVKPVNGADKVYFDGGWNYGDVTIPCLPLPETKNRSIYEEKHVRKQIAKRRKKNRNPKTHRRK